MQRNNRQARYAAKGVELGHQRPHQSRWGAGLVTFRNVREFLGHNLNFCEN